MPFQKIKEWLDIEKNKGSSSPDCVVLATAARDAIPHSRIVAIYFYTLGSDSFSEYIQFKRIANTWQKQLLSP